MIFNLAYGKTGYIMELSNNYHIDIIEPQWIDSVNDQSLAITEALSNPYNSKPLKKIVNNNDKVAIIFSDITRATPYHIILPAILTELQNIPQKNICFFCANGTHRLASDQELVNILGESIVKSYEIVQNDANNSELHEYVGTTTSGNEVFLNKKILQCNIKILTGFIEPHFFAGFSGGGKALIPGMAFVKTIKYNHSIANLSHENVKWGITYGNPLWEEIMEAAEFVPGLFLLNITLNKNKDITNVFAGDLRTAHMAGCQFVKDSAMAPVDKLYDIVITSNSGYPLDLNIYQTVKGMSAAAQIVKVGGNIIIAAECWDGIPSNSYYETILTSVNSTKKLMEFIKENESILNDTWQIYFQALIQQKAKVYMFSNQLDNKTIRKAFLNPVNDISSLIDELVRKTGPQSKICILPEGPQTIPYLKST
ncbi:MAG TPA: nickel-dependent lactate racemase [Bacteroidales bacterium]|nr:nickel-dependent lactate racemase [Bacteroidales bacterium]